MSISIDLNNKEVLHVNNMIFSTLHHAIRDAAEENNIDINTNLQKLLEKTDQDVYGAGAVIADIADYLKIKNEILQLAELIQKAIMREYKFFNSYEGCIKHLQEFHQSLITYANQLPQ